jgi:hypothetical protein
MGEKNYDFRKRLLETHTPGIREPALKPSGGELEITSSFEIVMPLNPSRIMRRAASDMQEYLSVSMGVDVSLRRSDDMPAEAKKPSVILLAPAGSVPIDLTEGNSPRGFRADCGENVVVTGYDEAGVMQGVFYLQEEMSIRRAPFLKKGTGARAPLFSPRMAHSGYGLDLYPDAHLASIARAGMDSILVFVRGVDATPNGYLDFNELCRRAAEWSLDVYAYSYIESQAHPDDPRAEEYYDGTYGAVFKACPAFKGVILVGESVEFPSKDERTTGRSYKDKRGDPRPSPGWFPCRDYLDWLNMVKKTIRRYKPDADVVFWTYNWGYAGEKERVELINSLPTDISLQVTFEMFETVRRGDVMANCVDYTLMFEGPGKYFLSEAAVAKRRGIRLYSMVNTGGLTWDIGVVPYEPTPFQWMKRYRGVLESRERYGLCGLMESHHFGFWPSFISELCKQAYTAGAPDMDTALRRLVVRDFGEENAVAALVAYRHFSDGIAHYMSTNEDQYGPFRIGPSYPLVLNRDASVPESPFAMFGNRIFSTNYHNSDSGRCSPLSLRLPTELKYLTIMGEEFMRGGDIIDGLAEKLDGIWRERARRLANLGRFIAVCARTTVNVKRWYMERLRLYAADTAEKVTASVDALTAIAEEEYANAESAIPLVAEDSRLGWEPSMEYMTDEQHIRWKLEQVRSVINNELQMYANAVEKYPRATQF